MINIKKLLASAVTALMLISLILPAIIAPAAAQNIDSAEFTVNAIIPDNQINNDVSYFDLRMTPGQTQTLTVEVSNRSDREIIVDVALHAASTNRNGIIEYQVAVDPDETLKYPFDTFSNTNSEIKIAANSTQKAEINIKMPENSYDGAILGGIIFTGRESSGENSNLAIKNKFSYVIGVKLTETDEVIAPDFKLKSVEPFLLNYRKAITVNIHNPVPLIVKNTGIVAHIYKKGEESPLFSVNKTGVDMAPNSVFPLPIEWDGQTMEAGEYTLKLKLNYTDKAWEWESDFTITNEEANDLNSSALESNNTTTENWWSTWWWVLLLIALIIILLLWIAFLLGRKSKENSREHKKTH